MALVSSLTFTTNILLWYGFTVLSTIYSKRYLNQSYDAHTLTLVTFACSALLKLMWSPNELVYLFKSTEIVSLAIFNVGTILLTSIGMNETSVSLTYMAKVNNIKIFAFSLSLFLFLLFFWCKTSQS